jgi:radical SAM superfamily enzyme YgiQ (UPF0313 family)
MFKTALLQIYTDLYYHRGNTEEWCPNIGLCIIASEMKGRRGFDCDPIMLFDIEKPETRKKLLEIIQKNRYGLIGLHTVGFYYFNFNTYSALVNDIKQASPGTKIVVGGPDSILSFNQPAVDFVVMGPGRKSFASLAEAVSEETSPYNVPNLFFRIRRNGRSLVEHSGKLIPYSIGEFRPFKPFLDWMVVGRDPIPQFKQAMILKSFGCYHNKSVIGNPHFKDIQFKIDYEDLFGIPKSGFTESARRVLKERVDSRVRGCTFCEIHRDKNYASLTTDETTDFLLEQSNYWLDYWDKNTDSNNLRYIEVFNEGSVNFLPSFLSALDPRGYDLYIGVNMRADDIIRNRKLVEAALEECRDKSLKLEIATIGFENFVQRHLDIYNKGTTVRQNVQAINIVRKIGEKHKDKFYFDESATFILFNPWTTLDELERNVDYVRKYKLWNMTLTFTVSLMSFRGTAIYEKIKQEGLLTDKKWHFAAPWRFKDHDVDLVYHLVCKLSNTIAFSPSRTIPDTTRWHEVSRAEIEAMRIIIRTIRENRGANKYFMKRICMRNIREIINKNLADYPP